MGLVSVERRGGAAVVTYANPPLGTMTAAGAQEMLEKIRPLVEDPAVRSIVITGGLPGIFIRHYDVGELSTASDASQTAPPPPTGDARPAGGFLALVDLLAEAPKPVVAAINGLCMGGGSNSAWPATSASPRRTTSRSACPRPGSASSPAAAGPSGCHGWSARPRRLRSSCAV